MEVVGPERGSPILLVAGGGGALWSWDDVVDEFGMAPVACRIARFDQAGVGRSVRVEPATSVEEYARDCLAVGREVLGNRFGAIGVSLGGATALRMAVLEPSAVSWLVVGCAFVGLSTFTGPEGPSEVVAIAEPGPAELMVLGRQVAGSFTQRFVDERPERFWEIVEATARTARHERLDEAQITQFVSHEMSHELAAISAPVRVVCGDDDRTFPLSNSAALVDRLPGAAISVVRNAGHALPFEAPQALLSAAIELIRTDSHRRTT